VNVENHVFNASAKLAGGEALILDNLRVLTGEAGYGRPEIQQTARTGSGPATAANL
jgi:hypothetical protein